MAFNLNKSDGTNPTENSSNKSNSKFDLSKKETTQVANDDKSSKSKTWIIALLGLLLIGGGAWYFLSNSKTGEITKDESSVTTVEPNSTATTEVSPNTDSTQSADGATSKSLTDNSSASNAGTLSEGSSTAEKSNASNNQSASSNTSSTATSGVSTSFNNKVPATFGSGSALVSNVDKTIVAEVIDYLKKNPNSAVNISGYASSEGELNVNQRISQSRADAFKSYLISKGVSESKIIASGKGIDNPIASNDTEEGRQKNRRVEISLQ